MKKENETFRLEELETLPTEQLETLLRAELDGSKNRQMILQILSILKKRDAILPVTVSPETEAAWERLQNDTFVFPERGEARKPRKWVIRVAAAAAVAAILLLAVPKAMGAENVFEILGRWTQDIFNFFAQDGSCVAEPYVFETDHPGLQQIYATMTEHGVVDPVVPTWLPEGYTLAEFRVVPQRVSTKVLAHLVNGDSYIIISYEIHTDAASNTYPKDEAGVETLEVEGKKYYIMENSGTSKAVWNVGNVECSVVINENMDVLCRIILSIHMEGH